MKAIYSILCSLFLTQLVLGQTLYVSPEYPIRNDRFYEIFALDNEGILLFRDRNNSSKIDILNKELEAVKSVNYQINASKTAIESLNLIDNYLQIIYSYRKEKQFMVALDLFNPTTYQIDTTILLLEEDYKFVQGNIRSAISEDGSKTLLFGTRDGQMKFIVIDNKNYQIQRVASFDLRTINVREEFRKVVLTNEGEILLLFERRNKKFSKDEHGLLFAKSTTTVDFETIEIPLKNTLCNRIKGSYNEQTGVFYIGGLYAEKTLSDLTGYFVSKIEKDGSNSTTFNDFSPELTKELYGFSANRKRTIRDFYISELLMRQDGGVVLVSEMQKEFIRRASYSTMSRYGGSNYALRGFVDYYNEDILITSINPFGEEDWYKVLYKKQFSQDDDGAFSSFFLMQTPSRLRILYNDEIKKSNTVSEYLMDPSGKFERNALLNTEYQNLQLRFRDAVQVSKNTLIVPSETNFKLSLVKLKVK